MEKLQVRPVWFMVLPNCIVLLNIKLNADSTHNTFMKPYLPPFTKKMGELSTPY